MGKRLSEGYPGFVHLVERRMLFHDEIGKLVRKHEAGEYRCPYQFITISRDIGALGNAVASELAARLQWKVYDKEIVDYIAKHNNVLNSLVDRLEEKTQSRIQDSIERLILMFHGHGFSNDSYHLSLFQALAALAVQGGCIILGHGGTFALQDQAGLHIRITASFPVRVDRLSRRWGISREKTGKIVQKTDKERAEFIQHHFSADLDETKFFHLVINTDTFPVDYVVASILGIMDQSRRLMKPIPAIPEVLPVPMNE